MTSTSRDSDRFGPIRDHLYTAVVGDVLDSMGRYHQVLPPEIRSIDDEMVIVGRAMPVLVTDVHGPQPKPFGRLTEALDQLDPDEVYVANGTRTPCAAWGEILTATARGRRAAGAVLDGYHRDTKGVLAQSWPVFSRGAYAQDAGVRAAVIDYRVATEIGGVSVEPGDIVFGDCDGVVVIPQGIEYEVIERALGKVEAEREVRNAILNGMSSSDAYSNFGVL